MDLGGAWCRGPRCRSLVPEAPLVVSLTRAPAPAGWSTRAPLEELTSLLEEGDRV